MSTLPELTRRRCCHETAFFKFSRICSGRKKNKRGFWLCSLHIAKRRQKGWRGVRRVEEERNAVHCYSSKGALLLLPYLLDKFVFCTLAFTTLKNLVCDAVRFKIHPVSHHHSLHSAQNDGFPSPLFVFHIPSPEPSLMLPIPHTLIAALSCH